MSTLSTPVTSELRLVEEFTVRAEIRPPLEVGSGPFGSRMIFELVAGRATGERFNAEVLSGVKTRELGSEVLAAHQNLKSVYR
ncbi:DUF3237 family protein [Protofrankia symbiont of Coriaria ruscifolia]|uniref:Uncharacterized protein n=1 Tax=Candidatus Protofrankia californiensis TaxID=1839754 RepID=A0A1C3NZ22_9ACTN|nr:DUF3237 family protein [Protofrankia symbiont of Coriaria ruscifolia]SBW22790.1 hypothetical protein FDG2_3131 [Candidatus Protofrankia californiensis]